MTKENDLGLNIAEKPAPTPDPVDKQTPDLISEIDSVLDVTPEEKPFEVKTTDYDDESVVISKADLEVLRKKTEDGENYRKGLLSLKDKAKLIDPGITKKDVLEKDKEYLDKNEFYNSIEKSAIKQVRKDEEINAHWAEILPYYTARRGKLTSADIVEDINDAYTLFRKYNPKDVESEDGKTVVELSNEKTAIKKGVGQEGKEKKKKSILKEDIPISEWF